MIPGEITRLFLLLMFLLLMLLLPLLLLLMLLLCARGVPLCEATSYVCPDLLPAAAAAASLAAAAFAVLAPVNCTQHAANAAQIVQLVWRRVYNPEVAGSNPGRGGRMWCV